MMTKTLQPTNDETLTHGITLIEIGPRVIKAYGMGGKADWPRYRLMLRKQNQYLASADFHTVASYMRTHCERKIEN